MDARVAKRASALKEAIDRAGTVYLQERLHAVRIALKKLRYAVELQVEFAGSDDRATLRLLKQNQNLLGRMHDLQVLVDHVRRLQGSLTPPNLALWRDLDTIVRSLESSCRRLHARYIHNRPTLILACGRLVAATPAERRGRTRRAG
jgi:CHAD domain-containing protein